MTEGLITVRDGSSIFHRDVGSGPAVVMVPAWSMTADAFSHQVGHLGQNYRVIALDPRGQGRSSTTLEGNDYVTHAHDLHDVVQHLGLTRFALVGWSNGALAAAHYVDIYGVDLLWALVDIDMPALAVPKAPGDWAEVPCLDAFQGFLGPLTVDPEAFRRQMVRFFVERDLSDEEERWLLAQMHSQPLRGSLVAVRHSFLRLRRDAFARQRRDSHARGSQVGMGTGCRGLGTSNVSRCGICGVQRWTHVLLGRSRAVQRRAEAFS